MLYSLLSAMDTVKTVGKILVWIAIFGGLFFVLFYLPNKREKAYQEEKMKTLSSLKVGTEIETIGGILGKIVEIDEKTIDEINILEATKLGMKKWLYGE